jgi:hypothetical protein
MRNVWTLALGVLLGGASLVPAQTPLPTPVLPPTVSTGGLLPAAAAASAPTPEKLEPTPALPPVENYGSAHGDDHDNACFWASAEYLLWCIKGGPTPPLASTGNPNDILPPGAIAVGATSTRVLFGDHAIDFGTLNGLRATVGGWCDSDRCWGIEVSGFYLEQKSVGFAAGADASGNPPLYVPAFRPDLGREGAFTIADPLLGVTGSLAIEAKSQLWGYEANGLRSLVRSNGFQVNALFGFRYLDLHESITLNAPNLFDFVNNITSSEADRFDTRNQFYGAQIGAYFAYRAGILSAELKTKLALGPSYQTINVQGVSIVGGPGAANPGTFLGGILTQPTNISRRSKEQFVVVPEINVLVGVNVLENLRLFVGYDFLYWNQVVRPGAQIDRNVNPTQAFGGMLVGPPAPLPQYNRTDFWAQGITFGAELRF